MENVQEQHFILSEFATGSFYPSTVTKKMAILMGRIFGSTI